MAETQIPVLNCRLREPGGKQAAKHLRQEGRVPAVAYLKDDDGVRSISLDFDRLDIRQLVSHRPTLIELAWGESDDERLECVLREVQRHPVSREPLHLDFFGITRGVKMDASVPVRLEGVPRGVKDEGGILQQVMYEMPILVLPRNLPNELVIDVSDLGLGDAIHVEDLSYEDIELTELPERTVVTVVAPRLIEEETEDEEGEEGEEGVEGEESEDAEGDEESEE